MLDSLILPKLGGPDISGTFSTAQPRVTTHRRALSALATTTVVALALLATTDEPSEHTAHQFGANFFKAPPQLPSPNNVISEWFQIHKTPLSPDGFDRLLALVKQVFGNVGVTVDLYHDHDEDWSRPMLKIASGHSDDFPAQFDLEDRLMDLIAADPSALGVAKHIIIRQI